MLDRDNINMAEPDEGSPPLLIVVIDTEEEFDWDLPFSRANTSTESIGAQYLAQQIFERHGVVPTYVVDYPVATSEKAVSVLRQYADKGLCEIGAHLHPWVNPPHEEEVTLYNSYVGNLPYELEKAKLTCLTQAIAASFGTRPTVYKAGRYGVGPNTTEILRELGYKIDLSVVARTSFAHDGGPDFCAYDARPYWFGADHDLLEIPVSADYHGLLSPFGSSLFPLIRSRAGSACLLPVISARLRLLERIRLTPEGVDLKALRRLTRSLLRKGRRVFCLSYHSSSLQPGAAPYVADKAELETFLQTIDQYIGYFIGELGGQPTTPAGLYAHLGHDQRHDSHVESGTESIPCSI